MVYNLVYSNVAVNPKSPKATVSFAMSYSGASCRGPGHTARTGVTRIHAAVDHGHANAVVFQSQKSGKGNAAVRDIPSWRADGGQTTNRGW